VRRVCNQHVCGEGFGQSPLNDVPLPLGYFPLAYLVVKKLANDINRLGLIRIMVRSRDMFNKFFRRLRKPGGIRGMSEGGFIQGGIMSYTQCVSQCSLQSRSGMSAC